LAQEKELLFSITKKDFRVETFRSGGKGGQYQNTTDSGVRITHIESGAVGESREERSQHANKKKALEKLVQTKEFKNWHKIKVAYALKGISDYKKAIEKEVDELLKPKNIKIEGKNEEGRWGEI
jgi:protein subunit release factor B